MKEVTLEQVIRQYIPLPAHPSSKGWYSILCKVCNDHGHKGDRAAFMFDGDNVAYHCFNCGPGMNTKYEPHEDTRVSKKMKTVLEAFGVPDEEWQKVQLSAMAHRGEATKEEEKKIVSIEPKEIALPDHFYLLENAKETDKWAEIARYYLEERGVDPKSYPFMMSSVRKTDIGAKWAKRVIIPIYKDKKLVFYQGRALVEMTKKYESPATPKDRVLYGYDRILDYNSTAPLYIVEGWFDAEAVDGVAVLGNELSEAHIAWINRSRRQIVYVPDKVGDGHRNAEVALKSGWKISTPDVGHCKDMSAAVEHYGKLYVLKELADKTAEGFAAEVQLGLYCEKDRSKKKDKGSYKKKR